MNIIQSLMLAATFFILSISHAGEIHQWRDKDGRLHFGDQQNAPKDSKIILNSAKASDSPASTADADKTGNDKTLGALPIKPQIQSGNIYAKDKAYEKGAPAGITPEKLTQCTAMVREHFNHENSPGEIRAFFVKLESACPKTGFICKSYKLSPQKNLCEPVQYKDGDNRVSHEVYNS
ncbi:DUF4124 domain-containing protein [Undibacterium pigrum]|uniref:Uncharacterized protein DUF4124 n=1 Tax=Undibacterium pigrum TaxID=401470 RepID=A0A318JS64_9BURK|nr:DUF4124 domain-containing protein [Undibacterium pigrum]PXX43172.1 uncharacterized protein DUF4124 [Undibacterium pigrum]